MTTDEAIAEARAHLSQVAPISVETLESCLWLALAHILESSPDPEAKPAGAAAQVAKTLAVVLAALEAQRMH
jgi:hypothetical protein